MRPQGEFMHKGLKEPHLFNAGSNPVKLIENLSYLFGGNELQILKNEISNNVVLLFNLGLGHLRFARIIARIEWRQRVSRLYYGGYNMRRAITLAHSGAFSTDSSDHKNVSQLPPELVSMEKHKQTLVTLREDRNLADYNHLAQESDLAMLVDDYQALVTEFHNDCQHYLRSKGIVV
jgi:hypothetical protein